jgi:restriction endonuclease S subunit
MAYKQVLLGDYFKFEKGLGYKGEFLVEDSEVALIGMDSHEEGGGYKEASEKPYSGPYKPEHVAETGDVIFAATDLTQGGDVLGSPLMVPESDKFETFIYSHHLLKAFQKREGFLPEYLYNLYRVKKYRRKAAYGDSGSTVRALPADVLEEQLVPLPDVKTQESINEIISLIDQQIENNKSLAKNLEALAQSIFRSWFVDFEPVHAKARGEKPFGMDDETAALFPDSFEESENGLIPKSWKVCEVSEVLQRVKIKSLPASSITRAYGNTLVLDQGDKLFVGYVDSEPLVQASPSNPFFVFGDHTCRMKILTKPFSFMPNLICLKGKEINDYFAFGVTFKIQRFETYRRHWMELISRKIIVPSKVLADTYGEYVQSLYSTVDFLFKCNNSLEQTRSEILAFLIDHDTPSLDKLLA